MARSEIRLRPDRPLTILEIAGSTIAQIAPAFSFYFGFAVIAAASGIGSPFTVLIAALAISIVGIGLANFEAGDELRCQQGVSAKLKKVIMDTYVRDM